MLLLLLPLLLLPFVPFFLLFFLLLFLLFLHVFSVITRVRTRRRRRRRRRGESRAGNGEALPCAPQPEGGVVFLGVLDGNEFRHKIRVASKYNKQQQ